MEVIDGSTARLADRIAMEEYGLSSLALMHRASKAVADHICQHILPGAETENGKAVPVTVLCGVGNNGADGLCIARLLQAAKVEVTVTVCADPLAATWEWLHQCSECRRIGISIRKYVPGQDWQTEGILVDAVFGVGLNRPVKGQYADCIKEVAALSFAHVVAVDIPSGIDADSGRKHGVALRADTTVTIGKCKYGLLHGEGAKYSGRVVVRRIGIPTQAYQKALASHSKTV
ncbi:MAG: NAD(P)H-hydrate epimerase [Eubacteriales bacterium]|nr:NAD(P)H-hydrate epimerase [Eubacteriales bacterium]